MIKISLTIICLTMMTDHALAKICRKGIACGNTCIASWKTCHVGSGSAINESDMIVQNALTQGSKSEVPAMQTAVPVNDNTKSKDIFKFRSYGEEYFLVESSSGKTLKCSPACNDLSVLSRGSKIEFLNNNKIIEFETFAPRSCSIRSCVEVAN